MNLSLFLELFAAGVAGFGLILNGISLWKNANARYLSNFQGFTREIRGLWESDNFDEVMQVISGSESSTTALGESTEARQF